MQWTKRSYKKEALLQQSIKKQTQITPIFADYSWRLVQLVLNLFKIIVSRRDRSHKLCETNNWSAPPSYLIFVLCFYVVNHLLFIFMRLSRSPLLKSQNQAPNTANNAIFVMALGVFWKELRQSLWTWCGSHRRREKQAGTSVSCLSFIFQRIFFSHYV